MIPVPFNVVTDNSGSWATLPTSAAANTPTYTDSGLSEGQSYEYRVCATNASGDSAYTDAAQVYTQPTAPTGLSAAFVSGGEIDLTWTINSTAAYDYAVERSTDGGVTWTADPQLAYPSGVSPGQTFTYADASPFTPSTPYAFRVRAYSYYGGYSGYTNVAGVATPAFPAAPSDLTGYAISDSQINLNWTDNSSNEAGFIVQRSADNGQTWANLPATDPDVTNAIDSGLADGKPYDYRVFATNSAGNSASSNTVEVTTAYTVPTIASAASAGQSTVTGTTDTLSVLGALPGGSESALTYVWSMTSGPSQPSFSANYYNGAKNTTVTFTAAGNYTFQVSIQNGASSVSSSVEVTVNQTLTSITVTPSPAPAILPGATQQFTAVANDQFGLPMNPAPAISWSVGSAGGTIDQTGLFTASTQQGPVTVQASSGGVSGQTQATVNQGIYQVTLTGRAYEYGYDASKATDGLSVTNTGWIVAAAPEDAVQQAISGSVTLNTSYDDGHSTLSFPADLGSNFGSAILGSDSEGAPNKLTLDAANSQYTGAIGMWDGDSGAPRDWDFYWNVSVATPVGTLDVLKNDGTALDTADKHTTGAFVTVNDNDDGDQVDSDGNPIPDYNQTGSTDANDPDLVEMMIEPIQPSAVPGSYVLTWAGNDFQVWADPSKTTPVQSGAQFSTARATPLYVEGLGVSSAADQINLWLQNAQQQRFLLDYVKVTTGKILGPNYLPAYGSYQYSLQGALIGPTSTNWSATGGAVSTSSPLVNTIGVSWNAPVAGTKAGDGWYGSVVYTPFPGFPIRLPVSVFAVNVTTPANAFQPGTPADQGAPDNYVHGNANSPMSKVVASGNPTGLTWQASVAVNGPAKGTGHDDTGIGLIRVGFIQNVQKNGFTDDGTYANPNNPNQPLQLQSTADASFSQGPILDAGAGAGPTNPWYLTQFYYTNAAGNQVNQKLPWKPTIAGPTTVIGDLDRPVTATPLDYAQDTTLAGVNASNQVLESITALDQFELNVCAETTQANLVYVREANADWSFNASGTIANVPAGNYPWTGTPNIFGVTPPAGWTVVTDGSSPVTSGPLANAVGAAAKFQ